MAHPKTTNPKLAAVEHYLNGVAKSLVDRLYGANGLPWGTRLTELEDTVLALRQHLSEQMITIALQRQADRSHERPDDYRNCPSCGEPVESKHAPPADTGTRPGEGPPTPPRSLETRGGDIAWHEHQGYCRNCRRSFSPSVQESRP